MFRVYVLLVILSLRVLFCPEFIMWLSLNLSLEHFHKRSKQDFVADSKPLQLGSEFYSNVSRRWEKAGEVFMLKTTSTQYFHSLRQSCRHFTIPLFLLISTSKFIE